jgi:hypothetical protein
VANRRFESQFSYSFERMPVVLMGNFTQTDAGAFATITKGGVTGTAVVMGTAANSITLAYTAGGTAGAEVVTVSGNAISVQIEDGVSTITQVRTALNASVPAAALAAWTGTSATVVAVATATSFSGGDDTDFTVVQGLGAPMALSQIGTGVYQILLANPYQALLSADIMLQRTAAVDLMPQIQSVDTSSTKKIIFRMQAAATPTNLANSDVLYIKLTLRNSSS